jgi:phospholipid/cholesterol/gamma-HCH transport system substrate-binding protein
MKISNETKVGALTAIAITLLILSFNFLKGKSLFKTGTFFYAKYTDAKGLMTSNPVYVNGYQIGSIFDIENEDDLKNIIITIKLKTSYNVPVNSVAVIKENPLGTNSIDIQLGDSKQFLNAGDTLKTSNNEGLLGSLANKISPISDQLKITLHTLDSTLKNISSIFDPNTKHNLQTVVANIQKTTESLSVSSVRLQAMLDKENGSITQSLNNVNSFTKNLSDNNEKITKVLTNVETTTDKLAKSDIDAAVAQLKLAAAQLNETIAKINSSQGSLGLLVNDKTLYNNLTNTVRSANILMDDLKTHPKRYVSVSVFGKKDKSEPLKAPLADSTSKH